ncbi:TM2 domain-containing protein [Spirulina subsalsa]|uniref:TM2 domain-containing protein n=1 Tax=Spirulina subsalsa TaxID=54311 RepID=UPI00035DB73D|nr:TM2 domain-containing protein [Spirulina subsalsa]
MNSNTTRTERLLISYALWASIFVGIGGIHRLYNGKIGSGLLWFCTFGLFGVGQFVDLFLIPNMAEEYDLKLRMKYGVLPNGVPMPTATIAPTMVDTSGSDNLRVRLLKAAQKRQGRISVTQAVLETGADFAEVEEALMKMVKKGYANIDNDPIKGTIIYEFPEL